MLQVFQFIFSLFLFDSNPPSTADLILVNGKVITVDQNFTIAEAVAIKKDKIIAVGSNKEIRKLANKQTKIIDLKGKTVIPGLIDAHAHPESASVSELDYKIPDLHTVAEPPNSGASMPRLLCAHEYLCPQIFFATSHKTLRLLIANIV